MRITNLKFLAIGIGILFIVIMALLIGLTIKKPSTEPVQVAFSPEKNTILQSGSQQTITISFSQPVDTKLINIQLLGNNVINNDPAKPVEIDIKYENNNLTAKVTPKNPIDPNNQFNLIVSTTSDGKMIARANYSSSDFIPAPAASNNPQLKTYLPYKNPAYSINFSDNTNTYQFHFLYNPKSPDDIETQYQKAKEDAIKFIKSKGIDLNSIVIEYKRF